MDLIHDFYVEAWGDLIARFDPSLAKLETYIFACFLRFARPRIARLERLRSMLMTPAEMESIMGMGPEHETLGIDGQDIAAARRAVSALPDEVRQLLTSYIDDAVPSERNLAARFDVTRYQLRIRLADALGRVAVQLGAANSFAEPDRAIAMALWADNRSNRETASLLCIPITEIQAARRRIFARLVHAVKGPKHMPNSHISEEAGGDAMLPSALVARALSPAATEHDLIAVRDHRDMIWSYLGTIAQDEARSLDEAADPSRLAAFYAALGEDISPPDATVSADLAPFLEARDDEGRSIGEAFTQTLLVNLPDRLTRFAAFYAAAPTLEPKLYDILARDPSVEAAGSAVEALTWFGITPVTIAEAARAICNLAEQMSSEFGIGTGDQLILVGTTEIVLDPHDVAITRAAAVSELAMSFGLPEKTTSLLFDWIIDVAARKPLFFEGYRTMPRGRDLILCKTAITERDLFRRWKSDGPATKGHSTAHRETATAA